MKNEKQLIFKKIFIPVFVLLIVLYAAFSACAIEANLVWSDSDGSSEQVFYSRYNGVEWSQPYQVTNSEGTDYLPSCWEGMDGRVWVVWSRAQDKNILLMYSVLEGETWTKPSVITTGFSTNTAPSVAVDANNVPWLVWAGYDGNDDEVYWSRYEQGQWRRPELIGPGNDVPDILPVISFDGRTMQVEWQLYNDGGYVPVAYIRQENAWINSGKTASREKMTKRTRLNREAADTATPRLPEFVADPRKASMKLVEMSNN